MVNPNETYAAFLAELTELTLRHGVYIGGCGCCGSPFLCEFTHYLYEDQREGHSYGIDLSRSSETLPLRWESERDRADRLEWEREDPTFGREE